MSDQQNDENADKNIPTMDTSGSDETEDEYEQDSFVIDVNDENSKLAQIYKTNQKAIEHKKKKENKRKQLNKYDKKQYKRDSNVIQNGGLFEVKVHIIECRDLKLEKGDAADVVTRVRIFDEKQSTKPSSQAKTKNPCWGMNHMLYFKFNLERNELSRGKCSITIYNEKFVLKNKQIGSYEFDLSMIYYEKYHEIYNQWVALVNTDKLVQTDDDTDSD
eukprot:1013990_1